MISQYYDGLDVLSAHNTAPFLTRISPSSISKFFSHPRQWYGEHLLGEPGFAGSTGSYLGSIIHYFADLGPIPPNATALIDAYLLTAPPEVDRAEVHSLWREMTEVLLTECVSRSALHSKEQFIHTQILPGVYAAGTYDALRKNANGNYTLRDYKSAAVKPSSFSYDYRMQLHTYAYILRQNRIIVDEVELCYAVRPTKTLPARYVHFIEPFTADDYDKIHSQLQTIAHSVTLWHDQPELRWALAQDIRLKPKPTPKLFKD